MLIIENYNFLLRKNRKWPEEGEVSVRRRPKGVEKV